VLFAKPRTLLAQVPLPVLMGLFMFSEHRRYRQRNVGTHVGLVQDGNTAPKERWTDTVPSRRPISLPPSSRVLGCHVLGQGESDWVLFPVIIAMLAPIKIGLEGLVKKEYMDILDEE
jgi:hypothetical protein